MCNPRYRVWGGGKPWGLWTYDSRCRDSEGGVTLRLWTCDPRCMAWEEITMETVVDSRYTAWEVGLPWTVYM